MSTKLYIEFETFIVDISAIYLLYKYNIYKMNINTFNKLSKDGVNDPVLNNFIETQKKMFTDIKDLIDDENSKEAYVEKFENNMLSYEDFIFITSFMNKEAKKIMRDGLMDDFFVTYIKESKDFFEFMRDEIYIKFIKETVKNIHPNTELTLYVFLSNKNEDNKRLYDYYLDNAYKFNTYFKYIEYDNLVSVIRENLNAEYDEYVDLTLASNNVELIKSCIKDLTPKGLSRIKLLHRITDDFNYQASTEEYKKVQNKIDISQIYVTV